jgi:predicted O-methyltransferase YrrM
MLGKLYDRMRRLFEPPIQWWLDRGEHRRMNAMRRVFPLIVPGYLAKEPVDWWHDQQFTAYLERFGELTEFNADRRWNLTQLMKLVEKVPGDIVECGVHIGSSAYAMCWTFERMGQRRTYHGFDSFEGLSPPGVNDGTHWEAGSLTSPESVARTNLAEYDVNLYRGWIPDRFDEVVGRPIAVTHIDVDLEEPTRQSLDFFYPRIAPGGLIVIDDYGAATCPGATLAVDRYMADKPEPVISLASAGAFIIKL